MYVSIDKTFDRITEKRENEKQNWHPYEHEQNKVINKKGN